MKIDWASLGLVSVVSIAAGVVVVALFSLGLIGLSARVPERVGGPDDGAPTLSPAAGTAVAVVCFAAVVAIVLYGLYIIAF
ncbi:hypothetical protein Acsp06_13510 [Actinomycetospora sp. NBRC 106375]|uniref:hypothetical protein n=1 Tax=Actinomycetospora sp. NBRC 106375 TaxID=3032207 RepID=UPI0024A49DC6|nr:hypothetical protein [Actinomycetospora sp. NBRC 106375]GLZ45166.1 hypothetical protein Acsp06_13510 [Actinomycetospora sp. NBRC 106375]